MTTNDMYDHEGTLREMSISSADDEDQQAAEWALDEIGRLRGALEYIQKWDRVAEAANPLTLPSQAEIARRCLAGEDTTNSEPFDTRLVEGGEPF